MPPIPLPLKLGRHDIYARRKIVHRADRFNVKGIRIRDVEVGSHHARDDDDRDHDHDHDHNHDHWPTGVEDTDRPYNTASADDPYIQPFVDVGLGLTDRPSLPMVTDTDDEGGEYWHPNPVTIALWSAAVGVLIITAGILFAMWYKRRNRHRYDPYADTPIPVLHTAEVTANRHWFGPKAKSDRRKWVQIREGASLASAVSPQPSPELQPTKPVLYRGDRI